MTDQTTTPKPWLENAWPTPAELADWLSRCTSAERLEYAEQSIATAQRTDTLARHLADANLTILAYAGVSEPDLLDEGREGDDR